MNKFLLAKRKYKKSVQYADAASCKDPESIEQRKNLLLAGHLNMSLCHLRLGNNLRAYHSADLALQIDSRNMKGLYRRGLVRICKSISNESNNEQLAYFIIIIILTIHHHHFDVHVLPRLIKGMDSCFPSA